MREMRVVIFKVGKEFYGIEIEKVNGIENVREVVSIPNAISFIKGIINLRGEIIPLYNLRKKFGYENLTKYTELTKFVIINMGEISLGLEVDEVFNIGNITEEQLHELPEIITNKEESFIKNILDIDEKLVALIEPSVLLREEEKQNIIKAIDNL